MQLLLDERVELLAGGVENAEGWRKDSGVDVAPSRRRDSGEDGAEQGVFRL